MSVLIKGMDMPKSCDDCVLRSLGFGKMFCPITGEDVTNQQFANNRHENCPIVEVLTPHGRLIDENELLRHKYGFFQTARTIIKNTDAVIKAEVSEE